MLALFTPEQDLLVDVARGIAAEIGIRTPHDLERVDRAKVWRSLSETGLIGLRRREGGELVASGVETMIVARELGAALSPIGYVPAALVVDLLERAELGDGFAGPVADGRTRAGLLLDRSLAGPGDPAADGAVLLGEHDSDEGYGLRSVDGEVRVVRIALAGHFDAAPAAGLTTPLSVRRPGMQLRGELVGSPLSTAALARWTALALTLVTADCLGAIGAALDGVIEYSKHRIAYGAPIGSFQALQHMCADAYAAWDGGVTAVNHAAWAVDELEPEAALLSARVAKAWAASTARSVTETVMQVYGGIGQTWEHIAHFYARRGILDSALFGGKSEQLDAIFESRRRMRAVGRMDG